MRGKSMTFRTRLKVMHDDGIDARRMLLKSR